MPDKQIIRIDASLMKEADCSQFFRYKTLDGYKTKTREIAPDYGKAGHKALEHFYRTGDILDSINAGVMWFVEKSTADLDEDKEFRTPGHLNNVLLDYFRLSVGDSVEPLRLGDGTPAVELPFEYPFVSFEHVEFMLCGVVDVVGMYNRTSPVFMDHKFTAAKQPDRYLAGYTSSVQMMTYSWMLSRPELGFLPEGQYPAAIINGIFLRPGESLFKRSDLIDFPAWMIEDHIQWLRDKCQEFAIRIRDNSWSRNWNRCENKFGKMCPFWRVCSIPEQHRKSVLDNNFDVVEYNPAHFGDEV